MSIGPALASTSAASPALTENGSNLTAPQNSPADEELENSVAETTGPGQIKITTSPNGSEIYIEDIYRGTTPALLTDVPPGFYEVELKQEGYDDVFERVFVRAGETAVIFKKLSFKEGVCSISSEPSGAKVYFDGKYRGTTPVAFHADEGSHLLKIKKTGYGTVSKEVNVSYDEPFVLGEKLHLSIFVYLAAALLLLAGGVFAKKKPEIPEFKFPAGDFSLEKYEKKLRESGKGIKERQEKKKEKIVSKHKRIPESEAIEPEKAEPEAAKQEAAKQKAVKQDSENLVELEKMSEPEFKYTVKKKEND